MKDRAGVRIREGAQVGVQTVAGGPTAFGEVLEADSIRARELDSVLVRFRSGNSSFVNPQHVEVLRFP